MHVHIRMSACISVGVFFLSYAHFVTFAHGDDAFDYIFTCSESKMTAATSIHFFLL